MNAITNNEPEYDYAVVGSGAGGGPLAANLAKAGYRVLLLEAGGNQENLNYQVPCFHGHATEDDELKWDYFVRHYDDPELQRRDSKFTPERDGVLYPRAGTLGGCTAHNAMITVYPHNSDWDRIAQLTGDSSWHSDAMRKYFERLERCSYIPKFRILAPFFALLRAIGINPGKHGYNGWLTTTAPDPQLAIKDPELLKIILAAAGSALLENVGNPLKLLKRRFDPNHWRIARESPEGLCFTPLATNGGKRTGTREYIREVQKRFPDNLTVRTNALVARVVLDEQNRAVGVEYLEGEHLYRADPCAEGSPGVRKTVAVKREVILAAGAFNTPQILKLSGIGPREELTRFGIDVRFELSGVGENLQDRYEVGVVSEMDADFSILEGCNFDPALPGLETDPCFAEWQTGKGVYTTNGAVAGIMKRSRQDRPDPDLFIFGLPGFFRGYFPGYSKLLERNKNYFTWAILKAHTNNTAGRVTLRSDDPRETPGIAFHYFGEGNDSGGEDLESLVEGVEFVRRMNALTRPITKKEVVPGDSVRSREEIREFIRNEAWGHHASCTCKMGPRSDAMAVVDSNFRVHGIRNLRVVDASVFPHIPGFFIVTAIYMISEKASEVILTDAERQTKDG